MIEICLKYDNMHIFVMINALICINNYIITCINSMLSEISLIVCGFDPYLLLYLSIQIIFIKLVSLGFIFIRIDVQLMTTSIRSVIDLYVVLSHFENYFSFPPNV